MPDAIPGKLVAPEPVPPVRQYSFTDWQVNNPTAPPPGDRLDAEFDRANGAISDTIAWTGTSLNTDGTLRTGIVGEPQLIPGLFDHIADDAVAQVQPLVVEAENAAGQAVNSASAALSYSGLAGGSATQAGQAATDARTAATTAQGAATGAQSSATSASASAGSATASANHADGSEAVAQAYADVGMAWAEHMPDTIPPNILAVMGVTGDHWSSRWWANRAAETLGEMEDLLGTIPPLAVVFYYTFIARAGQTVFTGADRDGKVLTYTPGPQQTMLAYVNGLLRTPVDDYTTSLNTLTFNIPRIAGDIVQIQVEGVATGESVYLPLAGGTMTGLLVLSGPPSLPLHAATMAYADTKVASFNTRNGVVTLTNADVTAVLPPSSTVPVMDGTAAVGAGTTWARSDHIHPTDTSRYAASNPSGYQTAAQVQSAVAPAFNGIGRNLIHNPLFNVAQRGAGPFTANGYTLDRWQMFPGGGDTASVGQQPFVPASMPLDEAAVNALANTFTGSAAAAAQTLVYQFIEDVRRLANKTVTISFDAICSSGTLKLGVSLDQYFGTGGSPSATVFGNGQSVTLSPTWTRYSLTFTLPSVSGKTLGTAGDSKTGLNLWYSSGATNATRAGNVGVQSGTIYVWGVQLEVGSVATPLEKPDPRYDLSNCQRFYQTLSFSLMGYSTAGGNFGQSLFFPVTMRANPTLAVFAGTYTNASGATVDQATLTKCRCFAIVTAAGLGYCDNFGLTASADL